MARREKKIDMANGVEKLADPSPVRSGIPIPVKRRMIELFASFHGVSEVAKIIKDEFGLDLDARTVMHYDASKDKARVGKRLKTLYNESRQAYITETAKAGVAHQAHRLQLIGRIVEKATTAKDFSSALKGLELAAKEMGGQLTNVAKVEHKGTIEHRHLSIEDAKAELAMRLGAVIEAHALDKPKLLETKDNPENLT